MSTPSGLSTDGAGFAQPAPPTPANSTATNATAAPAGNMSDYNSSASGPPGMHLHVQAQKQLFIACLLCHSLAIPYRGSATISRPVCCYAR